MNSWFWSSIFHTRDFPFTEKMDYFSAMAVILFGLIMVLHRIFYIRFLSVLSFLILLAGMIFYLFHISYLSFYRFDYGYNMIAGVTVGVSQNVCWLAWCAQNMTQRGYAWKIGFIVIFMFAGSLL